MTNSIEHFLLYLLVMNISSLWWVYSDPSINFMSLWGGVFVEPRCLFFTHYILMHIFSPSVWLFDLFSNGCLFDKEAFLMLNTLT